MSKKRGKSGLGGKKGGAESSRVDSPGPASPVGRDGKPLRLPPPGREVAESSVDQNRAFRPHRPPKMRITNTPQALAAFRMGYHGRAMWAHANNLLFLLFCRDSGGRWLWTEDVERAIPEAVTDLDLARLALIGSIPAPVSAELATAGQWFVEFNQRTIRLADSRGIDFAGHVDRRPPWEEKWRQLDRLCDAAIRAGHSLRPLFELGVAFGELELERDAYSSGLYDRGNPPTPETEWQPVRRDRPGPRRETGAGLADSDIQEPDAPDEPSLPGVGGIARAAARLGHWLVDRSPLLRSLARIGSEPDQGDDADAWRGYYLEHPEVFRPRPRATPHGAGRPGLGDEPIGPRGPDDPPAWEDVETDDHFDPEMGFGLLIGRQLRQVEVELAGIADSYFEAGLDRPRGPEISWQENPGLLTIAGTTVRATAGRQASTVRPILNAFQNAAWSKAKLSFERCGLAGKDSNSISASLNKFNKKLNGHLTFGVDLGKVYWTLSQES